MAKIENGDYAIVLNNAAIEYINESVDLNPVGNIVKVIDREITENSKKRKKYRVINMNSGDEFYIYSPYVAKISPKATPVLNAKYFKA